MHQLFVDYSSMVAEATSSRDIATSKKKLVMALSLGRQSLASRQSSNSRTKARMARAVSIIPIDA